MKRTILTVMMLLIMSQAYAVGVSPAKIVLTEPGDFSFTALADRDVSVRVEGDMAAFIQITENQGIVSGTLTTIPDMAPGDHVQYIIIAEQPEGSGTVAATAEVAAQLVVRIPRPGAYIEGDFSLAQDSGSDAVLATIMLTNLGTSDVTPEDISLTVGETRFHPVPKNIASLTTEKFQDRHVWEQTPGEYLAMLAVVYGDDVYEKERTVLIGTPIMSIDAVTYEEGAITPVDVSGRIGWNAPVNLTITVRADDTYEVTDTVLASTTFTKRLYIEAVPTDTIHVTISALGAITTYELLVEEYEQQKMSRWMWLLIPAILILIWIVWKVITSREEKSI